MPVNPRPSQAQQLDDLERIMELLRKGRAMQMDFRYPSGDMGRLTVEGRNVALGTPSPEGYQVYERRYDVWHINFYQWGQKIKLEGDRALQAWWLEHGPHARAEKPRIGRG